MTVHHPLEKSVVVIGPQFLTQYPVDLTIANDIRVTDVSGTLIFNVKSKFMGIHDRRHLKDAAGNILVTLKQKIMTMHRRWQVFRGESTDENDLLFSVKKSSLMQSRTQLDAFLASNTTSKRVPDFKYLGGEIMHHLPWRWEFMGLQMFERHAFKTAMLDTNNFAVTVYPNFDYAFIVALVLVGDEISANRNGQGMEVATEVAVSFINNVSGGGGGGG